MEIAVDASNKKVYEGLLLLPFEEVAVILKRQHDEILQGFIDYLFDILETQLGLNTTNGITSLSKNQFIRIKIQNRLTARSHLVHLASMRRSRTKWLPWRHQRKIAT
jgi:hypothetical protein